MGAAVASSGRSERRLRSKDKPTLLPLLQCLSIPSMTYTQRVHCHGRSLWVRISGGSVACTRSASQRLARARHRNGLRVLGIATDVSTLERLVLAQARCHHVMYKVVAYGDETECQCLHGHSIVCLQQLECMEEFGKAALEAAFTSVHTVFVGSSGQQGKLECAALKIDDLRLCPDIIINFLTIQHALHSRSPPPQFSEIEVLLAAHGGLPLHMKQNARRVHDVSIERTTMASDQANTRMHAQSAEHTALSDDAEAKAAPLGEVPAPKLSAVGVFEFMPQEMGTVVVGLNNMVNKHSSDQDSSSAHQRC